jgi:hypothetical protein
MDRTTDLDAARGIVRWLGYSAAAWAVIGSLFFAWLEWGI